MIGSRRTRIIGGAVPAILLFAGAGYWWALWQGPTPSPEGSDEVALEERLGSQALGSPASSPGRSGDVPLRPLEPKEVQLGERVYQANCAQCHGAEGEGAADWQERNPDGTYRAPPHDSTGHTWHHADGLLYRIVRDGGEVYESPGFTSAMPAFGDRLSPEEIKAVITYFKSLWEPDQRSFQAEVSTQDPFPDEVKGRRGE